MKLKITQKGFENYSGQMGMILFKKGVSVEDVSERDALRLSALFGCAWEDGSKIVFTKLEKEPSAPIGRSTFRAAVTDEPEVAGGNDGDTIIVEGESSDVPARVTRYYTLKELEAVADTQGMKGLRAIAGPLGIRGTSINGIIDEIMQVAGRHVDAPDGLEVVE